jgi:hypothetical protein
MTKWLRGAVVVLILANAAVFALWMMHDPLFTSLQHVVNGIGSNHSAGGSSINGGTRIISAKKKARSEAGHEG